MDGKRMVYKRQPHSSSHRSRLAARAWSMPCGRPYVPETNKYSGVLQKAGLHGLVAPKELMHFIKADTQTKIIRAPHTNTATLAKPTQIGGPSCPSALRITPTTAMRMYGTGIRKSPTATASGKLIATAAIAVTIAKTLAAVPYMAVGGLRSVKCHQQTQAWTRSSAPRRAGRG